MLFKKKEQFFQRMFSTGINADSSQGIIAFINLKESNSLSVFNSILLV